jgi:hypothetical protein
VRQRQWTCRAAAAVLRRPWLTRAVVALLAHWPRLARPVVYHLNSRTTRPARVGGEPEAPSKGESGSPLLGASGSPSYLKHPRGRVFFDSLSPHAL